MLKLIVVGDSCVGKSSLINRFCNDSFSFAYVPTDGNYSSDSYLIRAGLNYKSKVIEKNNRKLKLQIWDTTGKLEQNPLLKIGCNEPIGVILMFSPQNPVSFQSLNDWIEALTTCSKKLAIVLVSNKRDGEDQLVNENDIQEFAAKYNLRHCKIDVKEDFDVDEPFLELVSHLRPQVPTETKNNYENSLADIQREIYPLTGALGSTNVCTTNHSLAEKGIFSLDTLKNQQIDGLNGKNKEDAMEEIIRKMVKESLSLAPFNPDHIYDSKAFHMKPADEILLEYKQELLELKTNFMKFRSFISTEIEHMEQRTKESLYELKEKNRMFSGNLNMAKESIKNTDLPPNDENKSITDDVYLLHQKVEGYEKKFSEGMCYMENKIKLLSSNISKEVSQKLDNLIHKAISRQNDSTPQQAGPTHSAFEKNYTKRYSVFSPCRTRYEEPENFGEAVSRHNKSMHFAGRQTTNEVASPKNFEKDMVPREISKSLDSLDLSSAEIQHLDADMSHEANEEENELCMLDLDKLPKKAVSLPSVGVDKKEDQDIEPQQTRDKEEEYVNSGEEYGDVHQNEDDFDDARYEATGGSEENVTNGALKEEINTIWNTINQFVNNTQDHLQDLKEQILNTSLTVESRLRTSICPVRENEREEKDRKEQEDENLQTLITEVKDDVHNQIVQVQKELENEVLALRDNILCQYAGLSEKIKSDYCEMKDYIDEKIESIKCETLQENNIKIIDNSFLASQCGSRQEFVVGGTQDPSLNTQQEEQNDIKVREQEKQRQEKIQKELLSLQAKLGALEEETMNSLWNTINLVANRLDGVEKSIKSAKK